jgi:hypothetical protein
MSTCLLGSNFWYIFIVCHKLCVDACLLCRERCVRFYVNAVELPAPPPPPAHYIDVYVTQEYVLEHTSHKQSSFIRTSFFLDIFLLLNLFLHLYLFTVANQ